MPINVLLPLLCLNFGGFLASGIYRGLAFAFPLVVIWSMMSICALTFPKGFVRASVMASIGMAPVRTMLGTDGARPTVVQTASPRLLLEDYGVKSRRLCAVG